MSILCDWQIRHYCDKGMLLNPYYDEQGSLVQSYEPELINPTSLDFRLGFTALEDTKEGFLPIGSFKNHTKDNPYILEPNQFLLASTYEYFDLPPNMSGEIKLKSSRARDGLSHALAGWVDPGFHGILTLEIKNYSTQQKIPIYPGLRIGQIVFHTHFLPEEDYSQGRYAGKNKVFGSLDKRV